jgi:hypothetical protein
VKDPSAFSIDYHCCFFIVILNAVKDPSAFSNNQQLLLCVGFLPIGGQASFRMTAVFFILKNILLDVN